MCEFILLSYIFTDISNVGYLGILMMFSSIFLRVLTIGGRYATMHPSRYKKIITEQLSVKEMESDFLLKDWSE